MYSKCNFICQERTKVAQSSRLAAGSSVAVIDTSHMKQFLWHRCTNDTCTTRRWDQTDKNTTTFPSYLQDRHVLGNFLYSSML